MASKPSLGRPSPERLLEIREFADRDILDLVEPEEMYYFLDLEEQLETLRAALERMVYEWDLSHEITDDAYDQATGALDDLNPATDVAPSTPRSNETGGSVSSPASVPDEREWLHPGNQREDEYGARFE